MLENIIPVALDRSIYSCSEAAFFRLSEALVRYFDAFGLGSVNCACRFPCKTHLVVELISIVVIAADWFT